MVATVRHLLLALLLAPALCLGAIKDLRAGDEVLALAEWKEPGQAKNSQGKRLDQRLSYEKVVDIVTSHREQTLVHLTLKGGQTLTATEGHPFKTTEGWRDAILLRKGGQLLLKGNGDEPPDALAGSGQAERVATIEHIRVERGSVPVFNLEVASAHTFFVGSDGALVHNARCTPATKRRWEKYYNEPWPKNPPTEKIRPGMPQDGHHKVRPAKGGTNHPTNIEPKTPSDHTKYHQEHGYNY